MLVVVAQYRISEAARLLSVSDDTIRRHIDAGVLTATKDSANRYVIDGAILAEFVRRQAETAPDPTPVLRSARNRLVGLVTGIVSDTVMSQVEMQCGRSRVVSLMTTEAVKELGLEPGSLAIAVIKSTNVLIETPKP
jgi:molybdopterin-binding protein